MRPFKFLWICSSVLISGCAGFQTKPFSLSLQKNNFMSEYCQSGKQKKLLKTSVLYFTPKLESGLSIDRANQKNKKLSEQKDTLLKKLFYMLGDPSMSEQIANHGDEPSWHLLVSDDEKDVLSHVKDEDSTTQHRLFTFIVKIQNQNKIIIYQSNLNSRRMNYDKGYATDISDLMNDFTILTPKAVIEDITGTEFDRHQPYSTIILNNDGEIDVSKAIERRNDLWLAYVKKFTSIKEASEDNSRKSTIELSLDLDVFCKYGRRISDLQSQ